MKLLPDLLQKTRIIGKGVYIPLMKMISIISNKLNMASAS